MVSVKPTPAVPSPAATLVLLRDRPGGGLETLLIQRHARSKFAAGDHVFPGGKVEPDDNPEDVAAWCAGLEPAAAARALGLEHDPASAVRFWIGAIREAFEEVGILLAHGPHGRPVPVGTPAFERHREACQRDNRAFWDMVRAERLTLATDRLRYFAHWITPEERPIRFDTRFFVAETMAGQEARADGHEIVDVRWLSPAEALAARERREISLRVPTMKNLGLFAEASSVAEALRAAGERTVPTIRPRLLQEGGRERSLLPGDPGYF